MRRKSQVQSYIVICLVFISAIVLSIQSSAQALGHGLVVVLPKKMPVESRQPGIAMSLELIDPQTLYLYVEEQDGQRLAIYDVSDPGKIKLKKIVHIPASGPYDFIQSVSSSVVLIRYREGGQSALLNIKKAKEPRLSSIGSPTDGTYIVPSDPAGKCRDPSSRATDYLVFTPTDVQPVLTIKGVTQEQTDAGSGATYLLGQNGLTEIRNLKQERLRAASAPHWTNTIDDN